MITTIIEALGALTIHTGNALDKWLECTVTGIPNKNRSETKVRWAFSLIQEPRVLRIVTVIVHLCASSSCTTFITDSILILNFSPRQWQPRQPPIDHNVSLITHCHYATPDLHYWFILLSASDHVNCSISSTTISCQCALSKITEKDRFSFAIVLIQAILNDFQPLYWWGSTTSIMIIDIRGRLDPHVGSSRTRSSWLRTNTSRHSSSSSSSTRSSWLGSTSSSCNYVQYWKQLAQKQQQM